MRDAADTLSARIPWIDFAKGLAIILVVMHHARDYALVLVPPDPSVPFRWAYVDPLFLYIRLPLFFLVSGILASGRLSDDRLRRGLRKTTELFLVYLGWAALMMLLVPHWPNDGWHWSLDPALLPDFRRGETVLWYLWAIVMAFVFTCLTRKLPPAVVVLLACGLGLLLERGIVAPGGAFEAFGRYLPFYCLGARYRELAMRIAQWRSLSAAGLLVFVYALALPVRDMGLPFDVLRSLAGMALVLMGVGWAVEEWPRVTSGIGWLGRRTLPIYIFHFPIIASLGCAAIRHGVPPGYRLAAMLSFLPLLTALSILLSLGVYALIGRLGLAWTLCMPSGETRGERDRRDPRQRPAADAR